MAAPADAPGPGDKRSRQVEETPSAGRIWEKEAAIFADRWSPVISGSPNMATTCKLAFAIGKELGFGMRESGLLTETLELLFEQEGYTPRSLFRAGLNILTNRSVYKAGKKPVADLNNGIWAVLHVTDMIPAGRNSKGRKLWNVCCLVLSGPMAGKEFTTAITDSYMASIVRVISSARRSANVAGCDAFGMRMLARIGKIKGNLAILAVKEDWAKGKAHNSELRKKREDCPKGPCDRCLKGLDKCPYAIRRISLGRKEETAHGVPPGGGTGLHVEGKGPELLVPANGPGGPGVDGERPAGRNDGGNGA